MARSLATLGLPVCCYRYDTSTAQDNSAISQRLVRIPPFVPGGRSLSPTSAEAFYTCCQKNDGHPYGCDRDKLRLLESSLTSVAAQVAGARRLEMLSRVPCLRLDPEYGDAVSAVPFGSFEAAGRLVRSTWKPAREMAVRIPDSELTSKRLFYISHRWWRKTEDLSQIAAGTLDWSVFFPDTHDHVKHRWICQLIRLLLHQEGIPLDTAYVVMDYTCFDQDNVGPAIRSMQGIVARCTYVLTLNTEVDGSVGGIWDRAWVRMDKFITDSLVGCGVFAAAYESSIPGLDLDRMEVRVQDTTRLARLGDVPMKYLKNAEEEDPMCPWTGNLTREEDREKIREKCESLCVAVTMMRPTPQVLRGSIVRQEIADFKGL